MANPLIRNPRNPGTLYLFHDFREALGWVCSIVRVARIVAAWLLDHITQRRNHRLVPIVLSPPHGSSSSARPGRGPTRIAPKSRRSVRTCSYSGKVGLPSAVHASARRRPPVSATIGGITPQDPERAQTRLPTWCRSTRVDASRARAAQCSIATPPRANPCE